MNITQAAEYIGCSESYLKECCSNGRIRATRCEAPCNEHGFFWDITEYAADRFCENRENKRRNFRDNQAKSRKRPSRS